MPYYEFLCCVCKKKVEKRMGMEDGYNTKEIVCECGATAIKIPSTTSFELKGGGWFGSGYSKDQ